MSAHAECPWCHGSGIWGYGFLAQRCFACYGTGRKLTDSEKEALRSPVKKRKEKQTK